MMKAILLAALLGVCFSAPLQNICATDKLSVSQLAEKALVIVQAEVMAHQITVMKTNSEGEPSLIIADTTLLVQSVPKNKQVPCVPTAVVLHDIILKDRCTDIRTTFQEGQSYFIMVRARTNGLRGAEFAVDKQKNFYTVNKFNEELIGNVTGCMDQKSCGSYLCEEPINYGHYLVEEEPNQITDEFQTEGGAMEPADEGDEQAESEYEEIESMMPRNENTTGNMAFNDDENFETTTPDFFVEGAENEDDFAGDVSEEMNEGQDGNGDINDEEEEDEETPEKENEEMAQENEQIAQEDEETADENEEIADENEEMADENEEMADENEEMADENEERAIENEEMADENEEMAEEDEEIAEKNEELAQEDEEMADENEEIADENEEMADENEEMADENEEMADENEEMTEENEEMADENEEMTEENEEMANENEEMADENEEMADENEETADENEQMADENEVEEEIVEEVTKPDVQSHVTEKTFENDGSESPATPADQGIDKTTERLKGELANENEGNQFTQDRRDGEPAAFQQGTPISYKEATDSVKILGVSLA